MDNIIPPALDRVVAAAFALGFGCRICRPQLKFELHDPGFRRRKSGNALATLCGNIAHSFKVWNVYLVGRIHQRAVCSLAQGAGQGNAEAQLYLGVLYEYGRGVARDFVQAYKWYALAAQAVSSKNPKAQAVKNRDYLAGQMTAAQLAEAKKLVADWHAQ